ncbi:MAG: [FeFe] hydrogenase H-cluster radical SAM maturase HydG, partial [Treponema sp.]|nr:[FeFe] hydrogenase H-cluster radical SAM maturase HydG [Treponema sp.]
MYDVKSEKAEEFIFAEEVRATLEYARSVKDDKAVVDGILAKARETKGLSHREASVLLACDNKETVNEIYNLAFDIKQQFYGNRIVLFAPLYLSNYCVNGCLYCPYHQGSDMARKKLSQDEIRAETTALQDMGHKRLAVECGEDPVNNPIEYILESLDTIYSVKHKNGAIRRVNVNIAATTVENYQKLHDAGIGTYILFQETYDKAGYEYLHPKGPKHNYAYHTEAMDRAMLGNIDDVGLGVLFGLENYAYEFAALLMHAEHLEARFGVGPHTISVPRVKPAQGVDPASFDGGISDGLFEKVAACIRIAVPYTGMIIST